MKVCDICRDTTRPTISYRVVGERKATNANGGPTTTRALIQPFDVCEGCIGVVSEAVKEAASMLTTPHEAMGVLKGGEKGSK